MRSSRTTLRALTFAAVGLLSACSTPESPQKSSVPTIPADPGPLTHAGAVAFAFRTAPDADVLRARLATAQAVFDEATTPANPTLVASWEDFGLAGATPWTLVQQTYSLTAPLGDWLAAPRRTAAASRDLDARSAELVGSAGDLAAAVRAAYDDLVGARAAIELADRAFREAERQLRDVDRLVAAELAGSFERVRAFAYLTEQRVVRDEAMTAAHAANLALAFAIGCPRPIYLRLLEGWSEPFGIALGAADELVERALRDRPEAVAARARTAAAQERLGLAEERLGLLPNLQFGVRRQSDASTGVAGAELSLPVLDAGDAGIEARRAELLEAQAAERSVDAAIAADVLRSLQGFEAARSLIAGPAADRVAAMVRAKAAADRLFAAGEAGYLDVAEARRAAFAAERDFLSLGRASAQAGLNLERAIGAVEGAELTHTNAPNA